MILCRPVSPPKPSASTAAPSSAGGNRASSHQPWSHPAVTPDGTLPRSGPTSKHTADPTWRGNVRRVGADRVTVELVEQRRWVRLTELTNLDYRDHGVLRRTLERLVLEHRGTLKLDLSQWSLKVRSSNGGTVIATVYVTHGGETDVQH